ncbi:MAG: VCBS repeat-containing protein [Isosphaeraceae bacterium]
MPLIRIPLALAALAAFGLVAQAGEPTWKKHDINPKSPFEAAGVFDVDGDGVLDIVSGALWYKGPDFKTSYKVRDVAKVGTYYNCFSTIPMDVNGDGKMDFISCSYFGKNVGWVENPGKTGEEWTYHPIAEPGPSEAAVAVDLTGDGVPEILPNTVNTVVFYDLKSKGTKPVWKTFAFGNAAAGHGVGTGDVNGDGRVDLLTPKGWFEAPENPSSDSWPWHPEWTLGATGIQMLARDIDGDGLSDVVYGMGHNYGLFWIKQEKGPDGARAWSKPIEIDPKIASVHTLLWADLDGDGKADELVTGKRVYAHEREAGDTDGSIVAWYRFDRETKAWTRHVIYQGEPAKDAPDDISKRDAQKDFAPGTAGTGLEMTAIDIDGDGDLDLVCPGKSGLYLFENLGNQ